MARVGILVLFLILEEKISIFHHWVSFSIWKILCHFIVLEEKSAGHSNLHFFLYNILYKIQNVICFKILSLLVFRSLICCILIWIFFVVIFNIFGLAQFFESDLCILTDLWHSQPLFFLILVPHCVLSFWGSDDICSRPFVIVPQVGKALSFLSMVSLLKSHNFYWFIFKCIDSILCHLQLYWVHLSGWKNLADVVFRCIISICSHFVLFITSILLLKY